MEQLGQNGINEKQQQVVIISLESFYKPLTPEQIVLARKGQYNFDHPGKYYVHHHYTYYVVLCI